MSKELHEAREALGGEAAARRSEGCDDQAAFFDQVGAWLEELAELRRSAEHWKQAYHRASEHKELRQAALVLWGLAPNVREKAACDSAVLLVDEFKERGWL